MVRSKRDALEYGPAWCSTLPVLGTSFVIVAHLCNFRSFNQTDGERPHMVQRWSLMVSRSVRLRSHPGSWLHAGFCHRHTAWKQTIIRRSQTAPLKIVSSVPGANDYSFSSVRQHEFGNFVVLDYFKPLRYCTVPVSEAADSASAAWTGPPSPSSSAPDQAARSPG